MRLAIVLLCAIPASASSGPGPTTPVTPPPTTCVSGAVYYWNEVTPGGKQLCTCKSGCTGTQNSLCCGTMPSQSCVTGAQYAWTNEANGHMGIVQKCQCKSGCSGYAKFQCCDDPLATTPATPRPPTAPPVATYSPTGTPCIVCETWDTYETIKDASSAWYFKSEAKGFGNKYQSSASTAILVDEGSNYGRGKVLSFTGEVHYGDVFSKMDIKDACANNCVLEITLKGGNFYGGLADRLPAWPTEHSHNWAFKQGNKENDWATLKFKISASNTWSSWNAWHLMFEQFGPGPLEIDIVKVYPANSMGCECIPPPITQSPTFDHSVQFGVDEVLDHSESEHTFRYPSLFDTTPIVITGVPTENAGDWITVRLRNVSQGGFTMFGQPSSCKTGHAVGDKDNWKGLGHGRASGKRWAYERVPWMALSEGRRELPDGTVYEAGTLTLADHVEQEIVLTQPIRGAIFLASVQTYNGRQPVFLRVTSKSDNKFRLRMQEDEGSKDKNGGQLHAAETIGWVAMSPGKGTVGSRPYVAANTGLKVDNSWQTVLEKLDHPNCVFGTVGFNDGNGGVLRTKNAAISSKEGKTGIQLRVHEDQCKDLEMEHAKEEVSVLVVDKCGSPLTNRGVSGDPFVVDQDGGRVQFYLPLHKEVLLLSCGGTKLYGSAFGTDNKDDSQQWFETFRFMHEDHEELKVSIKRNSTELTPDIHEVKVEDDASSSSANKELSLLSLNVEGNAMTKSGAISTENEALIAAWKSASGETVQFSTPTVMVVQVKTAVAQKFDSESQQQLYTHLDLRFIELTASQCTDGVLAEIWGSAPMTQQTSAMLKPPK